MKKILASTFVLSSLLAGCSTTNQQIAQTAETPVLTGKLAKEAYQGSF